MSGGGDVYVWPSDYIYTYMYSGFTATLKGQCHSYSFYEDDILPFFFRSRDIFCLGL